MQALQTLRGQLLCSVASGIILSFCFPGWELDWLLWIWMLPLLLQIWRSDGAPAIRRPFLIGWISGLTFFTINLFWIRHSSRVNLARSLDDSWAGWSAEMTGLAAVLVLSSYLALYFGLWSWLAARFFRPSTRRMTDEPWLTSSVESLRSAFLAAATWAGLEFLRGWVMTGFGWNGLGVALYQNVVLIQITDIIGVCGLSFLPVFVACIVFNTITRLTLTWQKRRRLIARLDFTVGMLSVLMAALYGLSHLAKPTPTGPQLRVAMIQPNVPQAVKWEHTDDQGIYAKLYQLTKLYAEAREGSSAIDLVVWPESALPFGLYELPEHPQFFNDVLSMGDFSLMTGLDIQEPNGKGYTSAGLFRENFENMQAYHKVHLVPFGEYLPLRHELPFMEPLLGGLLPGDFEPGPSVQPLNLEQPKVQIIPLICFEDTVGRLARHFIRNEPQVIINVTNDGWFLDSIEPVQHLSNAVFRAVELRRPMIRACNTGVTCVINERGRITAKLEDPETGAWAIQGVLPATIQTDANAPITIYARWGDWFSLACLVVTFAGVCFSRLRRRRVESAGDG